MQRAAVGTSVTLEATFTDGTGQVVDPPTVLVSITDYAGVERISNATPVRLALGRYAYTYPIPANGQLGAWTIRWDATVNGSPVSGTEAFDVVAAGGVQLGAQEHPLVPLREVRTALGRELTEAEQARAGQLVGQLVRLLERRWNRVLVPRTIVGERHTIGVDGQLNLNRGPAAVVSAVRLASGYPVGSYWTLSPGTTVEVDYTVPGIEDANDVVGVLVDAVAAAIRADAARAGTAVSAEGVGPVKSFSVEGLSISYGDASSTSSSSSSDGDRLVVGSLKGLGRLRRPVLL